MTKLERLERELEGFLDYKELLEDKLYSVELDIKDIEEEIAEELCYQTQKKLNN